MNIPFGGPQQGWQCPVCGQVMAPFVSCCPCQGHGPKVGYGNRTADPDERVNAK